MPLVNDLLSGAAQAVVVGVGYVGLQWMHQLRVGGVRRVLGLDVDAAKVAKLRVREPGLWVSADTADVRPGCPHLWMVCVPTPVHSDRSPDERPVNNALATIRAVGASGDVVVLCSTVALPTLTKVVDACADAGMHCVHVPERMSPGETGVAAQPHLVGAVDQAAGDEVERLLTVCGVTPHRVASPQVAALAKLLENTRRDVNIALLNEFAVTARTVGVSIHEVVAAASTKRGFDDARFTPGMVGGHCVAVDPWLFAATPGTWPTLVPAARLVNRKVPNMLAKMTIAEADRLGIADHRALVLGATFKPDCPDVRNAGAGWLAMALAAERWVVVLADPTADAEAFAREFSMCTLVTQPPATRTPVVIVAVAHRWVTPQLVASLVCPGGLVVDPWNAVPGVVDHGQLHYLGL